MSTVSCDWYDLPCVASGALEWVYSLVVWVPRKFYQLLTDGLASTVEAFPPLDAANSFTQNAASAFSGAGYFIDLFAVQQGLALLVSALVLRFLLRRIPFIG